MKTKISLLKTLIQNQDADALNTFNTATAEILLTEDEILQTQLLAGWWIRLQKECSSMSSSIDLFQVIKLVHSMKSKFYKMSDEEKDVIVKAIKVASADETFRKESAAVFLEYTAGHIQLGSLVKSVVDSTLVKFGEVDALKPVMGDITHVLRLALPLLVTAVKSTSLLLDWNYVIEDEDEDIVKLGSALLAKPATSVASESVPEEDSDEDEDEDSDDIDFSEKRKDLKTTKVIHRPNNPKSSGLFR